MAEPEPPTPTPHTQVSPTHTLRYDAGISDLSSANVAIIGDEALLYRDVATGAATRLARSPQFDRRWVLAHACALLETHIPYAVLIRGR